MNKNLFPFPAWKGEKKKCSSWLVFEVMPQRHPSLPSLPHTYSEWLQFIYLSSSILKRPFGEFEFPGSRGDIGGKKLHRLCFFFPSFFLSVASFISRIFHLFFPWGFFKILFREKSAFTIFLLSVGCQYFPRQETSQNRRWKEIFRSVSDPVASGIYQIDSLATTPLFPR